MKRSTEIELAKELIELQQEQSAFLDDAVAHNPVDVYHSDEQFMRERERLFKTVPQPLVHSSELPQPGSFLRRDLAGLPVFVTRDANGQAHAFLNVCRHRGTRLVDDSQGCKHRFSCPYHAWTWDSRGELVGVPHELQGFPNLVREDYALKRLGSVEKHGWIWVSAASEAEPPVDDYLAGMADDFEWFDGEHFQLMHCEEQLRNVNWKILVEGGIEAYHFRVAHKNTIAPYFEDNLSSYRSFGPHLRSILARRSLVELVNQPEDSWRLRDHAQVLYSIFPINQLLVQPDHITWVQLEPLSATSTQIRLCTLAPSDQVESEADLARWAKNHAITLTTLNEDFDIGESIQVGLESGANEHLTFGRFEGALAVFNRSVEQALL